MAVEIHNVVELKDFLEHLAKATGYDPAKVKKIFEKVEQEVEEEF